MSRTLEPDAGHGLERLCTGISDAVVENGTRMRVGAGAAGIERLEASFHGQAFSPHRHDTYAIGITLTGVQTFRYRGRQKYCLPGQCHVLHPDELHDGAAGTEEGFSYRIIYVAPALVQEALGGMALPFVAEPVIDASMLSGELVSAIIDIDQDMDEWSRAETAAVVADMLAWAAGNQCKSGPLDIASLSRVRDLIAAQPQRQHTLSELERLASLDRWTLARQFRAAFGTTPVRFRTMRRLDHVRRLLAEGAGLAEASSAAGFADQSHMTRHFKRAYGLTPARWTAALA
jgi:AraC-like DNA-binding protein